MMSELKFKTNINCDSCIKSVKPFLDEAVGEGNWQVDTADEKKILTVTTTEDAEEVVEAVTDAGFKIQKLDN
jgi:copper chaperone